MRVHSILLGLLVAALSELGAQPHPSSVAAFLELTPSQIAQFTRNLEEYTEWYVAKYERGQVIYAEVAEEIARDGVTPLALGLRYAELETIRREIVDRDRSLLALHPSLLSPSQMARLQTLIEARRLASLGFQAECLRLVANPHGLGPLCHFRQPDQSSAAPPAQGTAEEQTRLERFLHLTPDQIARYRANQQEFRLWLATRGNASGAEREACDALASSPLDPVRIGTPLAKLAQFSREYQRRSGELIQANQNLLNGVQLTRLQILEEARELTPTVRLAENDAFLPRADGSNYFEFSDQFNSVEAYYGSYSAVSPANRLELNCSF